MRRLFAVLLSLLIATPAHAGWLYAPPGTLLSLTNTWSALQTFSAGLTVSGGNVTAPIIVGGTGTASPITLQSTSGVGTTGADIIFKTGNNGATEPGRFLVDGRLRLNGTLYGQAVLTWDSSASRDMINAGGLNQMVFIPRTGGAGWEFSDAGSKMIIGASAPPVSLLDLRSGNLTFSGANGQGYTQGHLTELTSIGSGVTTVTTTIQIPADAIVYAAPVRVVTQPGGTSTMTVTATTSATAFQKGTNISTVAGTTDPGTKNTPVNYNSVAAQTITYTFNIATTNALGQIRIDVYYAVATPPTS